MDRSIRFTRPRPILRLLLVVILAASSGTALAQPKATNTWTGGAGDLKWETGGNWSLGHPPAASEDAVIPGDSGNISHNGGEKKVNSFEMKASAVSGGTRLSPSAYSTPTKITAKKQVRIGTNNYVYGTAGTAGAIHGADVVLKAGEGNAPSEPGDVTNDGHIGAGFGHDGPQGGNGGGVYVSGDDIFNNGHEQGGGGGNSSGPNTAGGRGGSVSNTSRDTCRAGRKSGGDGGTGTSINGARGTTTTTAPSVVALGPGEDQRGSRIRLGSEPGGAIALTTLTPGQITADALICVDGGSPGTPIDLRGNPPGINVLVAGPGGRIRVRGLVLLDPGVSLADITEPDAVVSGEPCWPQTPAVNPGLVGLAAVSLALLGSAVARRRRPV